MRLARPLLLAAALAATAALSACETYDGPGPYGPRYAEGVPVRVEQGVVVGARPVTLGAPNTGGGAVVGGVSGAIVGSELAGRGGHGAGAILGAVGGALIGNAVENSNHARGFAYLVRLDRSGREIEVAQADAYPLRQGVHVAVTFGPRVRITPNGPPSGY